MPEKSLQACRTSCIWACQDVAVRLVTSTIVATGSAAEQWRSAAASAAAGDIAALRLLTMDVVLSPSDGQDRCGADLCMLMQSARRPRAGNETRACRAEPRALCRYRVPVASQDPIVAITCVLHSSGDAAMAAPAEGQTGLLRDDDGLDDAEDVS